MKKKKKVILKFIGRIPSKKNSKRILRNFSTGKPFIASSASYKNWEAQTLYCLKPQVMTQVPQTIEKTKFVSINFIFPDRRRKDLTNKAESIMDILVDLGVLKDDDFITVPNLLLTGEYQKGVANCIVTIEEE